MTELQAVLNSLRVRVGLALRKDLQDRVLQDSAVVLGGNLLSLGLGVISSAVLARSLGPEGLSTFAIVGAATSIAGTVSDLGLRLGAIRHIAAALVNSAQEAYALARAYARLKLVGSVVTALLLVVLAQPLSNYLHLPGDAGPALLRIGAVAMLATALSSLVGTLLHALAKFRHLILAQSANVILTVLLMSALWLGGRLDVSTALLVGALTAVVAGILSLALLPASWRRAIRLPLRSLPALRGTESRSLLSFSRWMWASNILSMLSVQVDVLLLNFFLPLPMVGIYALARNLAQKAGAVNQTLHTVLAPGVSALVEADERRVYVRQSLIRSCLLAALVALAAPLARPFILLFYGGAFAASINVFYALLLVILFDLLVSPLVLLALPLNRPGVLALSDGAQVVVLLLVGVIAVPHLDIYGIVVARLAARIAGALVALPPLLRSLRATQWGGTDAS